MQLHRMTAVFGRLQGEALELRDGLNILEAPNETGKSTWCAFLLSMLYGVNSRERERSGFIPDKTRYAPWSGSAMSGRLDCRVHGRDLTLTRSTRRQTAPMGEFQAVYTGTGDSVPGLTGANCGETLTGVSREVFERSAFIRQAGLPITQDAGLERRVAALISSGEEGTSYSEAAEALKKQLNRRRHNKTGQLPALEAELAETERQLEEAARLSQQQAAVDRQLEALTVREAALMAELVRYDQWESAQARQALDSAHAEAARAEETAALLRQRLAEDHIPENETIGRLRGALVNLETTRRNVEKARGERDEASKALLRAEAALNESPFMGQTPEEAKQEAAAPPPKRRPSPAFLILGFLWLIGAGAEAFLPQLLPVSNQAAFWAVWACIAFVIFAAQCIVLRRKHSAWQAALQKRFGTADLTEIAALAEDYARSCAARDEAQAEAERRSAAADTLYNMLSSNEQGLLLEIRRFAPAAFDTSAADQLLRECAVRRKAVQEAESAAQKARMRCELLAQHTAAEASSAEPPAPPVRSREAVTEELAQLRADLSATRSAVDRLTGQRNALGDPAVLTAAAEQLREQIITLEGEYAALRMAMDALDTANTTLQTRFSPELGRRTAEIFSRLTEGRYSGVVLDRAFHLSAEPEGDTLYRDAALLSAGTADQLYLAARLAICELVLPEEDPAPLVLDDALANFDDERCAAALQWLKEESRHRQILLFTCHSREAAFFAGDDEVSIQRLTGDRQKV